MGLQSPKLLDEEKQKTPRFSSLGFALGLIRFAHHARCQVAQLREVLMRLVSVPIGIPLEQPGRDRQACDRQATLGVPCGTVHTAVQQCPQSHPAKHEHHAQIQGMQSVDRHHGFEMHTRAAIEDRIAMPAYGVL
jgi:hypothetical protein